MHHYISFARGQDCQVVLQGDGESVYLPAGISGVYLWEDTLWKSDIAQADSAHAGGDGGEPAVKEREAQGF